MNSSTNINPLYDPSTDNQVIADDTQARLNAPLAGGSLSAEDQALLDKILELVKAKAIKLHVPSSLLNSSVYESLSTLAKGKADQNAVAMLAKIRDIVSLKEAGIDAPYQIQNLVHSLRLNKERLEEHGGDIFII